MKQLSFEFVNDPKYKEIQQLDLWDNELTSDQLIQEANAMSDKILNISGVDALCMAARGDFYGTDFEGSIFHSKLVRIISLLGW